MPYLPLCITGLGPCDVSLEHVSNLAVGGIMNDHTFLLVTFRAFEAVDPQIQLVTLLHFLNVLGVDYLSASFMLML
jgi:hypothetical protein